MSDGHITITYEPVIRTLTGKICSLEALARWNDPIHGEISPRIFVPVLEECRMIHLLDHFIMKQAAIDQYHHLQQEILQPPVILNLSRCDFELMDPCRELALLMEKYHLPHAYFQIEVTETALAQDEGIIAEALRQFRSQGHPVILDNFGKGYSSLAALKKYAKDWGRDTISGRFHVRHANGNYLWKTFEVVFFQQKNHPYLLLCLRDFLFENQPNKENLLRNVMASYGFTSPTEDKGSNIGDAQLWRSLMHFSHRKLFWKDTEGRFLGANPAFLRFYGIERSNYRGMILASADYGNWTALISWNGHDYIFSDGIDIQQLTQESHTEEPTDLQHISVNDAINLAIREEDPDKGITHMLAKIGQILAAERIILMEEEEDGFHLRCSYDWHKDDVAGNLLRRIEKHLKAHAASAALGYVIRQAPFGDIDDIIHEADANMYRDKQKKHRTREDLL